MSKIVNNIIVFSDFHMGVYHDFARPDEKYINDRFRTQIETLQKVFDIARDKEAILLFAGDLFHNRSRLEDIVFNSVFDTFAKNHDIKTYLLKGNHDAKNNTTESPHWLEPFKHLDHVTVMDEAKRYLNADKGVNFYALPYTDDVDYLKNKVKEFTENVQEENTQSLHSILVAHIGVDGSEVGRYNHRLEGAFSLSDLRPDVFDYIPLGHYHKRQFLGNTNNTFYVGNTIQTNFSDEGQEKGVYCIDLNGNGSRPEFIPIPNKQFITVEEIDENTQELVDNNYVRFILPQDQATAVEVYRTESDNIRVELQKEYKSETRIDIGVDSSEEQIVKSYTEEYFPEATEVALDILKEANNLA